MKARITAKSQLIRTRLDEIKTEYQAAYEEEADVEVGEEV